MNKRQWMAVLAAMIIGISGIPSDIWAENVISESENINSVKSPNDSSNIQVSALSQPVELNNHIYQAVSFNKVITWDYAKTFCEKYNGHLVTITSKAENDLVQELLLTEGIENCWYGASDAEQEGTWRWITGESWSFTDWAVNQGQPDNDFNGREDYLGFIDGEGWNDYTMDAKGRGEGGIFGLVIEWENRSKFEAVDSQKSNITAINTAKHQNNELNFDKDVFNFTNYPGAGTYDEKISSWKNFSNKYRFSDITREDYDAMLSKLSPDDRASVEEKIKNKENKANGTCWGMSTIVALNKIHYINFPSIVNSSSEDYNLHKLLPNDEEVKSFISCCQALVATKAGQGCLQGIHSIDEVEKEVEKVKKGGNPVRLSVSYVGTDGKWGAHSIVGYAIEDANYRKDNIEYSKQIKLYDCNERRPSTIYFNNAGQYFDPDTNWSNKNAYFCEVSSSLEDLSIQGNANLFQPTLTVAQDKTSLWASDSGNGLEDVKQSWKGYVDPADENNDGTINYILPNKTKSYTFIPNTDDKSINISLHYNNAYYSINSDSVDKVETSPNGNLRIEGNTGHYNIIIADNNKVGNNYHTYKMEGAGSGDVVMNLTNEGVNISGSAIKNAKLTEEGNTRQEKKNITGPTKVTQNTSDNEISNAITKPVTMFRLYNSHSGEHFFTSSAGEKNHLVKLGWGDEGIGWTAPKSGTPVYRLYNKNGGEHHYTTRDSERKNLIKHGWKDEGIGWYSGGSVPLYRQYNPNAFANNHNYTKSTGEKNHLIRLGWRDEGVAWYGVA